MLDLINVLTSGLCSSEHDFAGDVADSLGGDGCVMFASLEIDRHNVYKVCGAEAAKPRRGPPTPEAYRRQPLDGRALVASARPQLLWLVGAVSRSLPVAKLLL
jgi:hypothetical protein